MTYNWHSTDWPNFTYDIVALTAASLEYSEKIGWVSGGLKSLSEPAKLDMIEDILVSEARKSSEIEGEYLDELDVRSSVRRNLGLSHHAIKDKQADGPGRGGGRMLRRFRRKGSRKHRGRSRATPDAVLC